MRKNNVFGAILFATCLAIASSVEVYVMMPLNTLNPDGSLNNAQYVQQIFSKLRSGNVDGIMIDVWWGVVEKSAPLSYNWAGYQQLFQMANSTGIKVQAIMSFHKCGGNVGDDCNLPLPDWVTSIGNSNNGIYYADKEGHHNSEYLTWGIDDVAVLNGRTALQVYSDYMTSFEKQFSQYLGDTISEVHVGLGPAGELRYPSYPSAYWSYPGIGEFQSFDPYMVADLKSAASNAGHSEWGNSPAPSDAGSYNNHPQDTGFFNDNGSWKSDYGVFFMNWYANGLINHADKILAKANQIFAPHPALSLFAKVSGIHWWYFSQSHAAEFTAGYYNTASHDGYSGIAKVFASHNVGLDFTMLEMTDKDNSGCGCGSGPQELIKQVFTNAINNGIHFGGENALSRYDAYAYSNIVNEARINGKALSAFSYLRYSSTLEQDGNWNTFIQFVNTMHGITDQTVVEKTVSQLKQRLMPVVGL